MDLRLAPPPPAGPFTYLVGEHARTVVAIQDLRREVGSLLAFRNHVLDAMPHLSSREVSATSGIQRGSSEAPPGSGDAKTGLTEAPTTSGIAHADSGFSTDKASTSMGKSSSSSSGGELSGGVTGGRWGTMGAGSGDEAAALLGSAEDELWALLDAIERKGTRLRRDLERAEERETSHASDPGDAPLQPPAASWWPHSLPGGDGGWVALAEVERLKAERVYLASRVHRAEADGMAAHERAMELRGQVVALASEKRRLEEALRGGARGVTVSVGSEIPVLRRSGDAILPRVLKVPIRGDKWASLRPPSRIPQGMLSLSKTEPNSDALSSPSKTVVVFPSSSERLASDDPALEDGGSGRVVIERERGVRPIDGGLSMPVSLMKGTKVKVKPDRRRISAILREKDVVALRRQLLTTVMETEVLRRQLEMVGEEWQTKSNDWESEKHRYKDTTSTLRAQNKQLNKQVEELERWRSRERKDASVSAHPATRSIAIGGSLPGSSSPTEDTPTFSVHHGPNVKYDVVVYEGESTKTSTASSTRRPPIEKPPRRTRPLASLSSLNDPTGSSSPSPRAAPLPRPSSRTPPATPRSSPSPSLALAPRASGNRQGTPVSRRDSVKSGQRNATSTGHKNTAWFPRIANGTIKSVSKPECHRRCCCDDSHDTTAVPHIEPEFFDSISDGGFEVTCSESVWEATSTVAISDANEDSLEVPRDLNRTILLRRRRRVGEAAGVVRMRRCTPERPSILAMSGVKSQTFR